MIRIPLPEITEAEKQEIVRAYRRLLRLCSSFTSSWERQEIRRAFEFALKTHQNTRRKSGELYIFHPIAVAEIVVKELYVHDYKSVIAALLHDVVEDTLTTISDIREHFGPEIAHIVEGLTKISGIFEPGSSQQLENFKRLLLTISTDIRVVLIKLADRLHNMRTLDAMKEQTRYKIASETNQLYVPLANRLGFYHVKTELEDLALKYLEPNAYHEIASKLAHSREYYERLFSRFVRPLRKKMRETNLPYSITWRVKSIASIHHKMKTRNIPFEEVYDVFAVRIVLNKTFATREEEVEACWRVYSILTSIYNPHPYRLRDWITIPRSNGYESLHVTVMGPDGKWIEVQIRTKRMHEIAEKGPAAHWKYKEQHFELDPKWDSWIETIREALEENSLSTEEVFQKIKEELTMDEIYVFTPKGDLIRLPQGATALDFAYHIHTEVGNHAIAAKINHASKPLNTVLQSGDQVEILTSQNAEPKMEWLSEGFVITSRAKKKIKEALRTKQSQIIQKGKNLFLNYLEHVNKNYHLNLTENHPLILEFLHVMGIQNLEELYKRLGSKSINTDLLKSFLEKKRRLIQKYREEHADKNGQMLMQVLLQHGIFNSDELILGHAKVSYRFCDWCKPIAGDPVVAIEVPFQGIIIHQVECEKAQEQMATFGQHIIKVRWGKNQRIEFLTEIHLTGEDRLGILKEIVNVITTEFHLNIRSITIEASHDASFFEGYIKLFIHNTRELQRLIQKLSRLPGILKVERVFRHLQLSSSISQEGI